MFKWPFAKLKEEILIGKQRFSTGFCWKFDLGKFFNLIYLEVFLKKQKTVHQNVKKIDLYQMLPCLRPHMLYSVRIQQKTSTIFIQTPDIIQN